MLGPEGKRDELVGDRREARERQCAVDKFLDDHDAPKSEARREGAEGTAKPPSRARARESFASAS